MQRRHFTPNSQMTLRKKILTYANTQVTRKQRIFSAGFSANLQVCSTSHAPSKESPTTSQDLHRRNHLFHRVGCWTRRGGRWCPCTCLNSSLQLVLRYEVFTARIRQK